MTAREEGDAEEVLEATGVTKLAVAVRQPVRETARARSCFVSEVEP